MWIGLICAAVVCVWVCLSRIYLGMHTFLVSSREKVISDMMTV
jgi:membrane-associated phospholipid phosphatase